MLPHRTLTTVASYLLGWCGGPYGLLLLMLGQRYIVFGKYNICTEPDIRVGEHRGEA